MLASSSPELFVGNHVLLRLCVPRYPPLALIILTTTIGVCKFLIADDLPSVIYCLQISRYYAVFKVLAGSIPAFSLTL